MKKFEPRYRLIRYGQATKIERASRQQRMCNIVLDTGKQRLTMDDRQAAQEQIEGVPRYTEERHSKEGQEGQIDGLLGGCYNTHGYGSTNAQHVRFGHTVRPKYGIDICCPNQLIVHCCCAIQMLNKDTITTMHICSMILRMHSHLLLCVLLEHYHLLAHG